MELQFLNYPFVILILILVHSSSGIDDEDNCINRCKGGYSIELQHNRIRGNSSTLCRILNDYNDCLSAWCEHRSSNYNIDASQLILPNETTHCLNLTKLRKPPPEYQQTEQPLGPSCRYHGSIHSQYCTFYGEPDQHLRTFGGRYLTSRITGKNYLVDNPYFSVQYTVGGDRSLLDKTQTTPITKLTVVIKGASNPCTSQKIYEVDSSQPLSLLFTNLTSQLGENVTVLVTTVSDHEFPGSGEKVEIFIKYIHTILVIRRIYEKLLFSVGIPIEVLKSINGISDNRQLCVDGVDDVYILRTSSPVNKVEGNKQYKMNVATALKKCNDIVTSKPVMVKTGGGNSGNISLSPFILTDRFLDWCVYDLMAQGVDSYATMAYIACLNIHETQPWELKKRTSFEWPIEPELEYARANSPKITSSVIAFLHVIVFCTYIIYN